MRALGWKISIGWVGFLLLSALHVVLIAADTGDFLIFLDLLSVVFGILFTSSLAHLLFYRWGMRRIVATILLMVAVYVVIAAAIYGLSIWTSCSAYVDLCGVPSVLLSWFIVIPAFGLAAIISSISLISAYRRNRSLVPPAAPR